MNAESTRLLAEFVLGDPELTWCLDYGLELDNLNQTIPRVGGNIVVDEGEARLRLDAWAEGGRLVGRELVLLGDAVLNVFCAWAQVAPLDHAKGIQRRRSQKLGGAKLSLIRVPHPGLVLRLREDRSAFLGWAEERLRVVTPLYKRGVRVKRSEAVEADLQLVLDDEKVERLLAACVDDEVFGFQQAEEMQEYRRQLRQQERDDRKWEARQFDPDDLE